MLSDMTRRRFMFQTLAMIGGTIVAGDFLPLLAEAARRKQVLRVAVERDFETLRADFAAGYTNPTTLLNEVSREGAFSCARDRRGDGAVACQPPAARPHPPERL